MILIYNYSANMRTSWQDAYLLDRLLILWQFYYLSRRNEFGRVKALRIIFVLAFNCFCLALVTGTFLDAVSRRFNVNYLNLKKQKMTDNEIKKL